MWATNIAFAAMVCLGLSLVSASAPTIASAAPSTGGEHTVEVSPNLHVTSVEFGRIDFDRARGTSTFTPARELQMIPGVGYGWRMKVRTTRREISWTEKLALPSAPKSWGIPSNVKLSADRRRATTEGISVPKNGVIENAWIFADGDPPGVYTIDIEIDGVLVGRGEVNVRPH